MYTPSLKYHLALHRLWVVSQNHIFGIIPFYSDDLIDLLRAKLQLFSFRGAITSLSQVNVYGNRCHHLDFSNWCKVGKENHELIIVISPMEQVTIIPLHHYFWFWQLAKHIVYHAMKMSVFCTLFVSHTKLGLVKHQSTSRKGVHFLV